MNQRDQTSSEEKNRTLRLQRTAAGVLYALLVAIALWMVHDFLPAVVWATVLAIALWPLLTWLESRPQLQKHGTWLAIGLTLVVGLVFLVPFIVVVTQAGAEAADVTHWVQESLHSGIPMPDLVNHLPYGAERVSAWWQENLATPLGSSPAVKGLHGAAVVSMTRHVGARLAHGLIVFGFMLITLFFLFKAGSKLGEQLLEASRRAFGSEGASLARRMADSVRSTVTGLVVVGLGEGALLGIAYAVTGVPHATLLGMLTAIAAMLPFCAPLIFLGAALWLFVQGSTVAAIGVAVFGLIVVFVAEHAIRPVLIGGATRLPFLLVLFGILGGAETFGLVGLFIGPALMTILVVLWNDWVH